MKIEIQQFEPTPASTKEEKKPHIPDPMQTDRSVNVGMKAKEQYF